MPNSDIYKFKFNSIAISLSLIIILLANNTFAQSSELIISKTNKIAILPATIYNADLSAFEKVTDLSNRYITTSFKFASNNGLNHIITSGVVFSTQDFNLIRSDLLSNKRIKENSYLNPRIYYIDIREILIKTNQASISTTIEQKFNQFSQLSGANIILNKAIFASENANITKNFLDYINNERYTFNNSSSPPNSICTINVQELYSSDFYKNYNKQNSDPVKLEFNKLADKTISEFARKNNIDLIIESNSSSTLCNITSNVVKNLENS